MKRRDFIGACGLAVGLRAGLAPAQAGRMRRIGYLGPTSAAGAVTRLAALRRGMRRLGYVEGRNLVIVTRFGGDSYTPLGALAGELADLKVEVIVTHGTPGTRAAIEGGPAIPVVMAIAGDTVLGGLPAGLREAGGNVTGTMFFNSALAVDRLHLLRELLPGIRSVAALHNRTNPAMVPVRRALVQAAQALKLELLLTGSIGPGEFPGAFARMEGRRCEALVVVEDAMLNTNLKTIADLALASRLPAIGQPEFAAVGGLLAYGVDLVAIFERAAVFVDKILRGASPQVLPVERATRFEMIVNRRTARALGIAIPDSIASRADQVIE